MRVVYAAAMVLALSVVASAAPPELSLPPEVKGEPGQFIQVPAKTDGATVQWKAVDAGLNLFPVDLLKNTHTAVVTAPKAGRYRLIAVTAKGDELSPFAETLVIIGNAPIPPPPDPPTPPDPPGPVDPLKSFRVIFIYESGDNLTPAQRAVIFGRVVEDWLIANCTGGKSGMRRRDKDDPGENDATMAALWKAVQPEITVTPCVAMERNGKVKIVNLEATPAKMVETLQAYRGK